MHRCAAIYEYLVMRFRNDEIIPIFSIFRYIFRLISLFYYSLSYILSLNIDQIFTCKDALLIDAT